MSAKTIEVTCQCGNKIARYVKLKPGFLIKMYLDQILIDYNKIFSNNHYELNEEIFCPQCKKRVATIKRIHGRLSAKINHGVIHKIST